MHYKNPKSRSELVLFPQVDLWIDSNNSVRLIDTIIDSIIAKNPERFIWKGLKKSGCTSYSPSTMCKLLLYCYFNWISGSRRMEKETYRNLELLWLLGDLHPDHWTICSFRRENKAQIRLIAIEFRKFLKSSGYIEGKTIAVDGSKMKAYTSPDMFTEKSIINRMKNIEKQLEKYLNNIEEIDNLEDQLEEDQKVKKDLQGKITKLEKNKKKLKGINQQLKATGKKYLSPNDPDASLMKGRDGKKAYYNLQSGLCNKHKMIALADIYTDENDMDLLEGNYRNLKEQLDIVPENLEADTGYGNTNQIMKIEEETQTNCYIPIQEPVIKKIEKENNISFEYDHEKDELECTEGKRLKLLQRNYKQGNQLYNIYHCSDYQTCPIKKKCTKSKNARKVKRNIHQNWIDKYKCGLKTTYAKERIRERKSIVEHPFGTIKMMMGKHCFILTKKHKVQIEIDLYSTAYNLKRMLNIENLSTLMNQVKEYNWKIA